MSGQLTKPTTVASLMTDEVVSVESSTPVRTVLDRMTERKFSALPVVDHGHCVGIVTATDLLALFRETNEALHNSYPHYDDCLWAVDLVRQKLDESPIREIMSYGISHVSPETSVQEAAKIMKDESIHHLAVMDNETLVGFVSLMDLVKALA